MNNLRRKMLREILVSLESLIENLEAICEDENDARDNMPESLQDTDKYTTSEEASDAMDSAIENLRDAVSSLEEIQ